MRTLPGPEPFTHPHPSKAFRSRLLRWGGTISAAAVLITIGVAAGHFSMGSKAQLVGNGDPVYRADEMPVVVARQLISSADRAQFHTMLAGQTTSIFRKLDFLVFASEFADDADDVTLIQDVLEQLSDYAAARSNDVRLPSAPENDSGKD